VLALMDRPNLTDADVKAGLTAAKVDPASPGHPSVETLLHALCLQLPGISFIGHTHASAINMLTCSVGFEQAYAGRLFPDEIVLCGPAPVLVPYTDPGVPLAKEVWARASCPSTTLRASTPGRMSTSAGCSWGWRGRSS
jgi:rhamnose utilization protein RhaD (predicted bifunctional aldolase and dehydrogenase)